MQPSLRAAHLVLLSSAVLFGCAATADEPADVGVRSSIDVGSREEDAGSSVPSRTESFAACAAFAACEADWPEGMLDRCARSLFEGDRGRRIATPTSPDVACILAAGGDCAEVRACLGWTLERRADCSDGCEGDTLVACRRSLDATWEERISCARTGRGNACVQIDGIPQDGGTPSFPACATELCPENALICEGDDTVWCPGSPESVRSISQCPAGASCGRRVDGTAAYVDCIGTGAECDEGSCDGTIVRPCVGGRFAEPFDCAARGLVCERGSCVSPLPGCAWPRVTCDGDVLSYCYSGEIHRVDCAARGFASCTVFTPSASLQTASCIPSGGRLGGDGAMF